MYACSLCWPGQARPSHARVLLDICISLEIAHLRTLPLCTLVWLLATRQHHYMHSAHLPVSNPSCAQVDLLSATAHLRFLCELPLTPLLFKALFSPVADPPPPFPCRYKMILVRHGLMLVGYSYGAKTSMYKCVLSGRGAALQLGLCTESTVEPVLACQGSLIAVQGEMTSMPRASRQWHVPLNLQPSLASIASLFTQTACLHRMPVCYH